MRLLYSVAHRDGKARSTVRTLSGTDPGFFNGGCTEWLVPRGCRLPNFSNLKIGTLLKTVSLEILAMPQCRNCNEVTVQRVCLYFYDNIQILCQFFLCFASPKGGGASSHPIHPPPPPKKRNLPLRYASLRLEISCGKIEKWRTNNRNNFYWSLCTLSFIYRCSSYKMLELPPKLFQTPPRPSLSRCP